MVEEQRGRQYWIVAAIVFAGWTAFALITTYQTSVQIALRPPVRGSSMLWSMLMSNLLDSYLWALTTLAVFWLAHQFPVERGRILRAFAVHSIGGAVILLVRFGVFVEIVRYGGWLPNQSFELLFWTRLNQNIVFYVLLLGVAHTTLYYRRYRERERAAERLAAGLALARLQVLKMQLHPHFLFNTLNAISALIPAEAQPARRMVAHLGDMLRIALDHEETQEVTLRDELAFLEPYLEIEQARLGDRLTVAMNIDPATLDACVPHLILQPLVENAIRHGIAPRIEPGTARISATLGAAGHSLELEVRDDGPGIETDTRPAARKGVGLDNIKSRLEQLYGDEHRFDLRTHPEGGAAVRVVLPFRRTTPSRIVAGAFSR
jgi:two-component sensor histidine kinase